MHSRETNYILTQGHSPVGGQASPNPLEGHPGQGAREQALMGQLGQLRQLGQLWGPGGQGTRGVGCGSCLPWNAPTLAAKREQELSWVFLLPTMGRQKALQGLTYHKMPRCSALLRE